MPFSLRFECCFTSPFHTSRRMYGNLYTCAPWILGTTLRGAILNQIIQRRCPAEQFERLTEDGNNPRYHLECPGPCGAQGLFDTSGQARFSFGHFIGDRPPIYRFKVGIDRASWSVSEGALLAYEVYPGGEDTEATRFEFFVRVPDGVAGETVEQAVKRAGKFGIGRFRNQGFGCYRLVGVGRGAPAPVAPGTDANEVECSLTSPYILPAADQRTGENEYQPWEFAEAALRHDLEKLFGQGWSAAHLGPEGNGCLSGPANVEYDYLSRWCYEDNRRHNRLALMPQARFAMRFQTLPAPAELQELAWGFGEWSFAGFGAIGPGPP